MSLAPKAQLVPSCPRLRRGAHSGRKHRAPCRLRCVLGLFSLGERCRGVRETWGHSKVHQATWLGLRVAPSLAYPRTSASGPGPGSSPAVLYPSYGLGGVPRHADSLGARPGGGDWGGLGVENCSGTYPGHPCPGPLSAAWRRAGVAAALSPSRATCAQAGGPGRARIRRTDPLRVSDSWLVPGDRVGRWEASPPTTPAPPRGSLGHRLEGSPELEGGPLARRGVAGPLLPSPSPPCCRPAPVLQSGFCGARRPAPRLRAPRGGWLGARRGWRCAPPRLHCCAPGAQGSHAPRAPRSRPPGGSADRWHGPRGCPGLGLWAEALKGALSSAGPRAQPAHPPARPRPWPSGPACGQRSWA